MSSAADTCAYICAWGDNRRKTIEANKSIMAQMKISLSVAGDEDESKNRIRELNFNIIEENSSLNHANAHREQSALTIPKP